MVKTTGNNTITKTKQHHVQPPSLASTHSTSKKNQNKNSEETIQELLLHIVKLEKKVKRVFG